MGRGGCWRRARCSGAGSAWPIEAVGASALGVPVLDALQELVDHSLLRLSASSVPLRGT
jgi:hypothetical protein